MITRSGNILEQIDEMVERKRQVLINTMLRVGEECINNARTLGTYTDQTGNLRSSIGYAVYVDGERIFVSDLRKVKDGDLGVRNAEAKIKSITINHPHSIILVVVAGMNYAIHVELKGYNVLTSAQLTGRELAPRLLRQLGFKI